MTLPGQTAGVSVFFDPIAAELGISRTSASIAYAAGTLAGILPAPIIGRWIDRRGPRLTATVIAGGLALACAFMATVQSAIDAACRLRVIARCCDWGPQSRQSAGGQSVVCSATRDRRCGSQPWTGGRCHDLPEADRWSHLALRLARRLPGPCRTCRTHHPAGCRCAVSRSAGKFRPHHGRRAATGRRRSTGGAFVYARAGAPHRRVLAAMRGGLSDQCYWHSAVAQSLFDHADGRGSHTATRCCCCRFPPVFRRLLRSAPAFWWIAMNRGVWFRSRC